MKKGASFLAVVLVVFLAFSASKTASGADDAVLSSDLVNEYPHEGGDALNDLMRSLVRSRTFDKALYGLEGNYEIIGEAGARLEEGGEVNRVRLIALRREDGVYDRGLILEVIPPEESEAGKKSFIIPLPDDVRGFQSSIAVKNFISSEKSEILLTVSSGRWGERFLIIAVAGKQGEIILDTADTAIPTVVGRFFNDYRAEIIVLETGERAMIDLSPRKADYNRRIVYNESGTLRSRVIVWVDKLSLFESVDVDQDGILEIRKIMDMSGAGRADRIAYVEATLKYAHDRWTVTDSWIAPAEDLRKLPLPQRVN